MKSWKPSNLTDIIMVCDKEYSTGNISSFVFMELLWSIIFFKLYDLLFDLDGGDNNLVLEF